MRLKILSLCFCLSLIIKPCLANHHNPIETLQKLQEVQDQIARGDLKALDAQLRILSELGAQLKHMDEVFFSNPKNFYIVLLYLVHGGNPEHVRHILEQTPPEEINKNLIEAIMAYAQGREGDFHAALNGGGADLDDANWPRALRASLYLALTPYIARKDPALAESRLDYIRLVAPGSLYEEAALRQQVKIIAKRGDEEKLKILVRHYATRFANSPYMRDFWAEVAESLGLMRNTLTTQSMERFLSEMPEKLRYPTYLRFARQALIEAKKDETIFYAQEAQKLANSQELSDNLARFYQLAALSATEQANTVRQELQDIQLESLPPRDRPLMVAARNVAETIAAHFNVTNAQAHDGQPEIILSEEEEHDSRIESILDPVQKKLDEIDTLLENER